MITDCDTLGAECGYYPNICFKLQAKNSKGYTFPLIDGGAVDWAYKLTNRKNELAVMSGLGIELLHKLFI